jgi:hypothetical protein
MREMIDEMKEKPAKESSEDRLDQACMSRRERRAQKKADFKERISTLSGKEKFFYIMRYYLPPVCIAIFFIACAVGLFSVIYKNSRPVTISYAIVNVENQLKLDLSAFDDYAATQDVPDDSRILSDVAHVFDPVAFEEGSLTSTVLDEYTGFDVQCDEGYYDIIITDEAGLTYFSAIDSIALLDTYLPAELHTKLSDWIVNTKDSQGDYYESAIDISDTDFAKSLNTGYSDIYLVFPMGKGESQETAVSFLEYIFE